jgi:hypothetical protein
LPVTSRRIGLRPSCVMAPSSGLLRLEAYEVERYSPTLSRDRKAIRACHPIPIFRACIDLHQKRRIFAPTSSGDDGWARESHLNAI